MSSLKQHAESERIRKAVLAEVPDCLAIYVYGSRAGDQARTDSDLDVAVLLPPDSQLPDRLTLAARLASRLNVEVDMVDLRRASDVLRREVLASGIRIHDARPDEVLEWEAQALTRYGHYRYEVADLLADFR
ncbi:MAG: nucleotidyltransferase domain-containing protein, partial [Wenzhouxiangella sp.]